MTIEYEYPLVRIRIACPILAAEFGEEHYARIQTPKDVVSFLESNFPGFKKKLIELSEEGFAFRLTSPLRPDGIEEGELSDIGVIGNEIVLHRVLQASGAFGRIVGGLALIAVGAAVPFAALGGGTSFALLGGSLLMGGLNQLLTPRARKPKEEPKSTFFNQVTGVADPSACVPILLGEMRTPDSAMPVLSSSLDTVRIS